MSGFSHLELQFVKIIIQTIIGSIDYNYMME